MNAYILSLEGQGDTHIKIVDKETFDWVISENLGNPNNESGWEDKTCPPNVRKRAWEDTDASTQSLYGSFENFYPDITIGSPHNDRALFAPAVIDENDNKLDFYDDTEAYTNYVTEQGIHIQDSFEGCIY